MILFLVFLLGYVLSQFFRAFLAVIAPELSAELGLGAQQLANISAVFFLVFALAQFPLGVALDRIGPRRTVPLLMLTAALGAALLANAKSGFDCIVANGLIGLGCSPIYMGALYVFARTAPPERFGYLCASLIGLGSLGNLAAATPLSYVAQAFGWRSAFYGIAVLTLLSAALHWVFIKDPPQVADPDARRSSGSVFAELGQILKIRKLWPLMPLAALAYGCVAVERGLWSGPYFSQVHDLAPVPRGNAVLIMAAAMSIGALVFGALDRSPGRRTPLVMAGSLLTAAGFLGLALIDRPSVWIAVAMLGLVGWAGLHLPLLTAQARTFYPEHLIGRGITFFNFLTIGGAGLVQWISGIYVDQLQTSGLPPAAVYSKLHLAFGLTILVSALIYCVFGPGLRRTQS